MFSGANVYTIGLASDNGGEHVDPVQTDVLATTDSLPKGRYLIKVTLTASDLDGSRARFEIQHRDNTDDEVNPLESAVVSVPVDDCRQYEFGFSLDRDERITVVPYENTIGTLTAAINWQALSQ